MVLTWLKGIVVPLAVVATACGSSRGESTASTGERAGMGRTPSSPRPAVAGTNGPGLRERVAGLKLSVRREFDLSHVEPHHFAAALGKDPVRIFEFVRDYVAYEPYTGSLRGPRGTLLAMAGNSADRAALLAAMLQHAGFRVRFARGTLSDDLSEQLVASIWEPRQGGLKAAPATDGSGDDDTLARTFIADVERDSQLLQRTLRTANVATGAESFVTRDALLAETRQHYWVEYSKEGVWTAMDPSFASAAPGQGFVKPETTWDALPDGVFHRVEMRVRVEELNSGKAANRDVLRYAAKAADLSGVDVILAHAPADEDKKTFDQVRPFFVVGLNQMSGSPFSLTASRPGAAPSIADAFGGGSDDMPQATAEFVEMEFIAPDGRRSVVTRELFDRVGKSRRSKGDVSSGNSGASNTEELSAGIHSFFFTTGAIDPWHLIDLSPEPQEPSDEIDVGAGLRRISTVFSTTSDQVMRRIAGASGPVLRSYLDTPRVQVSEWSARNGAFRISLDLRRNGARVITSEYTPELSFRAQVLHGVVSGTLERRVLEHLTRPRDDRELNVTSGVSTSWLFERARATKAPLRVVTRDSLTSASDVPADTRARIAEAIGMGHLIVAPDKSIDVDGSPRLAWWQVDAKSGATIGVIDEGLHGAQQVEAVIVRYKTGHYGVAFRVNGRFISTGGRLFRFQSRAQAEHFVTSLGQRLTRFGYEYSWFAM